MEYKKICGILILFSVVLQSGCQKTPEKEVVVNRSDGLDSSVVVDAVSEAKERELDIPKQWEAEEIRGEYDNVVMSIDLEMEPIYTTNLPVIEMSQQDLTEEKLEELVNYFAKDEMLYQPKDITVEELQYLKGRIENKEGEYGNPSNEETYSFQLENIDKLVSNMYGGKVVESQEVEVKFQQRPESLMYYVITGENRPESEEEYYFAADIGEDGESSIEATTANEAVGNDSSFSYEQGYIRYEEELNNYRKFVGNEEQLSSEYDEELYEQFNRFEELLLSDANISKEEGVDLAKDLLTNLELKDFDMKSTEKIIWFSNEDVVNPYAQYDALFQLEWSKGKSGYCYEFVTTINNLPVWYQFDPVGTGEMASESYVPPFTIETISITVTEEGIQSFSWEHMAKEVQVIADNTKLMPLEEIEEKLAGNLYYSNIESLGPPPQGNHLHEVKTAQLGYTSIPAYENPQNVWLVPTWFFEVLHTVEDAENSDLKLDYGTQKIMLNALDGGYIADNVN